MIATWLLGIVQVTSLAMKRLPRRVWHRIHLASYATFFLTSLHGTLAGTDAGNRLYQVTSLAALAAVIFSTVYRILTRRRPRPTPARRPATPAPEPDPERVPVEV